MRHKFSIIVVSVVSLVIVFLLVTNRNGCEQSQLHPYSPTNPNEAILGIIGAFEVVHWPAGDTSISVYNDTGSSLTFGTRVAEEWITALTAELDSDTFTICANRAVAEVTRIDDDLYGIVAFDAKYPQYMIRAHFSVEQANQIVSALRPQNRTTE